MPSGSSMRWTCALANGVSALPSDCFFLRNATPWQNLPHIVSLIGIKRWDCIRVGLGHALKRVEGKPMWLWCTNPDLSEFMMPMCTSYSWMVVNSFTQTKHGMDRGTIPRSTFPVKTAPEREWDQYKKGKLVISHLSTTVFTFVTLFLFCHSALGLKRVAGFSTFSFAAFGLTSVVFCIAKACGTWMN